MGVGARGVENWTYQEHLQGSEKKLPGSGQRQRQYSLEKIGLSGVRINCSRWVCYDYSF